MLLPLLAVVSTLSTTPAPPGRQECDGGATEQFNSCLLQMYSEADSMLQKYRAAAETRLRQVEKTAPRDAREADAPADFDKAEQAWKAYRDAECGAVFEYWSGGTIRVSAEAICRIRLTRLHTHTIWREWLTYVDNTPPSLPEPPVPAAP